MNIQLPESYANGIIYGAKIVSTHPYIYKVLVKNPNAIFSKQQWITWIYDSVSKGFTCGHYDLTEVQARKDYAE